jgi:hypothetical protein
VDALSSCGRNKRVNCGCQTTKGTGTYMRIHNPLNTRTRGSTRNVRQMAGGDDFVSLGADHVPGGQVMASVTPAGQYCPTPHPPHALHGSRTACASVRQTINMSAIDPHVRHMGCIYRYCVSIHNEFLCRACCSDQAQTFLIRSRNSLLSFPGPHIACGHRCQALCVHQ